ncbi:thiol:disulfide interchange protein DsbA/DsbL [Thiohalorhabdus methylotrophus]|uniref:Thiol:disulfide interchange protein n=1 Tax=Thiohalorhabdus methylotrophus TaxID=3242694 RepID=A0ABV4TWZ6_9GAMM
MTAHRSGFRTAAKAAVLMVAMLLGVPAAGAADVAEGIDYRVLEHPAPVGKGGPGVEVAEWFWYGCPHCYRFDPELSAWAERMGDQIHLVRLPALARPTWQPMAAAFLMARHTDRLGDLHSGFFEAVHEGGRSPYQLQWVRARFEEAGVSGEQWREGIRASWIREEVRRIRKLERAHQLQSVPTLVIAGRYVTNSRIAGSRERMLEVAGVLVRRLGKEANGEGGSQE